MKIYRDGEEIYDLHIDDQTTINRRLMVENTLTMRVDTARPLDLQIGDYTQIEGERYELAELPDVTISDKGVYLYDGLLVGNLHRLDNWLLEQGAEPSVYFYGTITDHIDWIMAAIKTKEEGWSAIKPTANVWDKKNVDYASMSCLSALHKMAEEFDCEFDITQKRITFERKIERPTEFSFAVGQGKGLYKISRGKASGQKVVTRLFGLGGKQNMPNDVRLSFEPGFVERNIELYGLREEKVTFDDIYPRRNGAVTGDAVQKKDGTAFWLIEDSTLDFNLTDQIVEGAKIIFNSGECAGLEFDISSYNHATKIITFHEYTDNSSGVTYVVPNPDRRPKSGDKYVFTGILMPESYVTAAKAELKAATEAEIARSSVPQHPYTVEIDPRYIRQFDTAPRAGDLVRIVHDEIGLDAVIRIIGVTFAVNDPWSLQITINDKILVSSASSLLRSVRKQIASVSNDGRFHPMMGGSSVPLVASTLRAHKSVTADSVTSAAAVAAMIGYGNAMVVDGQTGESHVWTDHVHARKSFETLEMRYRKMIVSGEELVVNNGGVVSAVLPVGETFLTSTVNEKIVSQADEDIIWPLAAGDERLTFVIKGEAGVDYQQFVEDDILRYTWRDAATGLSGASGYLVVRTVIDEFTYTADILEGSPQWLREGMTVALFGNVSDPDRQGFLVLSARERTISIFDGVNSARITPDNLKVLLGNLSGVVDEAFPEIGGYGLYSQSCYLKGQFILSSTGNTIDKELADMNDATDKGFKSVDTKLEIINGKIESKVSQTDYDALGVRVKDAESRISQTAEQIESKVSKAEYDANGVLKSNIISSINQSAEKITLQADRISLEGFSTINKNFIIHTDGSLEAKDGKFTGEVHATSGQFTGIVNATSGQFGRLYINTDGDVSVRNKDGYDVSFFMSGEVTALSALLNGNASATSAIAGTSIYLDTRPNIEPPNYEKTVFVNNQIDVTYDNTEVFVNDLVLELCAEITAAHQQSFTYADLYLSGDNGEYYIGSKSLRYDWMYQYYTGNLSEMHTLNTSHIVKKGKYRLKVYASVEAYGADGLVESWHQVNIHGGSLSYDMVADANKTQLGRGLAIVMDINNHLYYGHNATAGRYELVYKGYSDMPNTALAGYRISSRGSINLRFGAKAHPQGNATYLGNGKYEIPHFIGHTNYNPIVSFETGDDNWFGAWKIISRDTNSAVIKLADMGSKPVEKDFSITFFGKN